MNKKYIYCLLIPLLVTGCSSQKEKQNDDSGKDDSNAIIKEDVTINFLSMTNGDYLSTLQSLVDDFMKVEPHVKVNIYNPLGTGNYNTLEKYVVAGFFKEDYPDIVQCYPDNVVKYIAHDYVVALDKYLDDETYGIRNQAGSDYIDTFMKEGSAYDSKGTTYSLPFCKSTELMYYNEDALLGLDLSSVDNSINNGKPLTDEYLNSLTWEEFFDKLCPALKAENDARPANNKIYKDGDSSCVLAVDSDENFFITLANQYGYGYTSVDENGNGSIDFNNENMKNLVKSLKTAKDNKYLQTKGTFNDYVSSLFTGKEALFTISSTAGLSYNVPGSKDEHFSVGVAKIPYAEGKEYSSINQGPSVCILDHKDDNRSLASYLLWKHITNEKNATKWALSTGYMGIRNSTYSSQDYQSALTPSDEATNYEKAEAKNFKKISEVRDFTFNTALFKGSSNARTNVGKLLKDCLNSKNLDLEIDNLFKKYSDEAKTHLASKGQ